MLCPDQPRTRKYKKKKCRKKHSEIVIESYNKEDDKFHLLYYGTHISQVQFEYHQEEDVLFDMIKKTVTTKKYGLSPLIKINDLKKILKTTKIKRARIIGVRYSDLEYSSIISKAKRRNLDKSEFVRIKSLS